MKGLRKILVPIVLFFTIVVGHTETVYGQVSSPEVDSCICYTDAMDKMALECLVNSARKDSLLQNLKLQILNFNDIVRLTNDKNTANKTAYEDEKLITTKLSEDLDKSRKRLKTVIIAGPLIGILVGILVTK